MPCSQVRRSNAENVDRDRHHHQSLSPWRSSRSLAPAAECVRQLSSDPRPLNPSWRKPPAIRDPAKVDQASASDVVLGNLRSGNLIVEPVPYCSKADCSRFDAAGMYCAPRANLFVGGIRWPLHFPVSGRPHSYARVPENPGARQPAAGYRIAFRGCFDRA